MLRRLFAYRFLRILLWVFVTLLTLLVLLWTWINWSGKRRWAATQSMLQKAGETLDFLALVPETPPDTQNLLAIEPLQGIAAVVEQNPDKGEPGAKRKALDALKMPTEPKAPASDGVTLGKATDIQDWVRYWQGAKWIDLPAAPTLDARAALTAMDAKFPVLKQLADLALDRPAAMFTPGMQERSRSGMLFAMHVPHYAVAQNLGRALSLRARLALAANDSPEAVRCITAITRLTHASREEGLLLGFLVGSNLDLHAVEAVWHGLREHAFIEDDLRRLKGLFATDETTKPYLRAMRAEMAAGVDALQHMQAMAAGDEEAVTAMFGHGAERMVRLLPSGMFDHWKSSLVETELRHLIQPLHQGLIQGLHAGDLAQAEARQNSNVMLHPDRFIDNRIMPVVSSLSMNALLMETRRRQAFTALALEQFFLKQGKFPEKLEQLTVEFLPAGIPLDPCDGKPLRYAPAASGSYVLWSVAVDGADDGGKVNVGTEGHGKLRQRDYRGDWAWQYSPVPAAAAQ